MSPWRAYIDFCRRHGRWLMVGVGLVTLLAAGIASQLSIQADLARLLPGSAPSVVGLERLEKAYGGQIGRLTVVLDADERLEEPAPKLRALADRLDRRLSTLEDVTRVESRRPVEFFERHRLLYADLEDLRRAHQRLDERMEWEKARRHPLFIGVGDEEPPQISPSEFADEYRALAPSTYYINQRGDALALFIYPSFPAAQLDRSQRLVDRVEAVLRDELGADLEAGQSVDVGLTGRYKKRIDLQSMLRRDLTVSTSLALVLILGFLFFFLRSFRGTLVVLVPLITGTIWAFAWAQLVFGSLNIMTAFLGAVLLGLGVDYGIHLYSRYHHVANDGDVVGALVETLVTSGRANLFAALTTAVALGSLLVSEFQAFLEFGAIALGGLLLILIAYFILFPCIVLWAHQHHQELPPPASGALSARLSQRLSRGSPRQAGRRLGRYSTAVRAALIAVVVVASVGLPQMGFERDFSAIQSTSAPSWQLDKQVNALLGRSQTPAVVLTDSEEQAETLAKRLRREVAKQPEGYTVDQVISLASFVPDRQSEKIDVLDTLRRRLEGLPEGARTAKLQSFLSEIDRVLASGRVRAEDLPREIRMPFSRKDTGENAVVLIFPAITLSDMDEVEDYAELLRELPAVDGHSYDAISDALLLSDIVVMAERDAYWMLGVTIAGLILLSVLAFRDRRFVGLQLAITAVAILVAVGINGLLGVDFNFMNILVLPIWIGLGVDAAFHLLMHVEDGHDLRPHITVGLAVAAGYLTSMIGFATLLLARHNGLMSLGQVAVIGLGSILLINLLVQMSQVLGSTNP
ncbi:MAG: efflux RND transporter permease subunit [Persicimonas sp.]